MNEYERNDIPPKVQPLLEERFGHDTVIALATVGNSIPWVRYVNAYYENGAFYIVTDARSNKMKHIADNPNVGICGEWFSAQGLASNLGWFGDDHNAPVARKLRQEFSAWIENGHSDLQDFNTCILCVRLTKGILFAHGTRYDINP